MKKMMKKLTAALLALTCIPVTGLTASAADGTNLPWCWGDTTWDAFEGYEPFDDHGMLSREGESVYLFENTYNTYCSGGVVVANPRMDTMRFVLRDDVDVSAAEAQMREVLDAYFPELKDEWDPSDPPFSKISFGRIWNKDKDDWDMSYELRIPMSRFPEDAETLEAEILLAFAKRQLISEFYGFGETAYYATGGFDDDILAHLYTDHYDDITDAFVDNDWDGIQDYLTEHYPGYMVEQYVEISPSDLFEGRPLVKEPVYANRIVPTDELTLREKLELMIELYDLFGIAPNCVFPDSDSSSTAIGHNALEQPGDVTLDCEIDIVDVIAANKAILGASTLCNTAKKNCDINGDGTPDTTDALAILKEVVGLTTNFVEP